MTRTTVVLLVVVCTLGFILLTFAFAPLANLMLTAAQRLAIQPALTAASELATARDGERAAQRRAAKLEAERQRVAQLDIDLEASETRIKQLQLDLDTEKRKAAKFADELTLSKSRLKSTTTELHQSRARVVEVEKSRVAFVNVDAAPLPHARETCRAHFAVDLWSRAPQIRR